MAILSNALPLTLLVGLFVRAVAAARATSTGLVKVFCAATLTARRKDKNRIRERIDISRITHMSIATVAYEEVDGDEKRKQKKGIGRRELKGDDQESGTRSQRYHIKRIK